MSSSFPPTAFASPPIRMPYPQEPGACSALSTSTPAPSKRTLVLRRPGSPRRSLTSPPCTLASRPHRSRSPTAPLNHCADGGFGRSYLLAPRPLYSSPMSRGFFLTFEG